MKSFQTNFLLYASTHARTYYHNLTFSTVLVVMKITWCRLVTEQ